VAIGFIGFLTATASPAAAQSWLCSPVYAGESGAAAARRLTGDAGNLYQPWFRIATSAGIVVPQSRYARLRADWRVCLPPGVAVVPRPTPSVTASGDDRTRELAVVPTSDVAVVPRPTPSATAWRDGRTYDTRFAVRVALAAFLMMLPWWLLDEYVRRTRPVRALLRFHAERFIDAFARPLLSRASGLPPISTQLRFLLTRQEVEILIAPVAGRRYPNLFDHKLNVEYDVRRVLSQLDDRLVVTRPLRVKGRWVVIRVRTAVGVKEAGVT
jgi:hypothetical protein